MTKTSVDARVITVDDHLLPHNLRVGLQTLRDRFCQEAVGDAAKGFVTVKFMNRPPHIDSQMLAVQADVITHFLADSAPTRIIGIPNSGLPLTEQVAKNFPAARLVSSIKPDGDESREEISQQWKDAVKFDVYSYTKKANITMVTKRIEPGERYLIIDDVAAWAHAASGFLAAIKRHGGVPVAYAVGFEKKFQRGVSAVAQEYNIPVLAVISVNEIIGKRVRLSP